MWMRRSLTLQMRLRMVGTYSIDFSSFINIFMFHIHILLDETEGFQNTSKPQASNSTNEANEDVFIQINNLPRPEIYIPTYEDFLFGSIDFSKPPIPIPFHSYEEVLREINQNNKENEKEEIETGNTSVEESQRVLDAIDALPRPEITFSLEYKDYAFELFGDILPQTSSPSFSIVSENGENIRNDIDSLQQFAQIVVEAAQLDLNFEESSQSHVENFDDENTISNEDQNTISKEDQKIISDDDQKTISDEEDEQNPEVEILPEPTIYQGSFLRGFPSNKIFYLLKNK